MVIIAPQNHMFCLVVLNNGFQIFNWNARSHQNHLINIPNILIGIPNREVMNGYSDNIHTKENPLESRFIKAALYFRINETHIRLFTIAQLGSVEFGACWCTSLVRLCAFVCFSVEICFRLHDWQFTDMNSCVVVGDLCVKLRLFFKKTARIATLYWIFSN